MTKTHQAIELYKAGKIKDALKIFKTFKKYMSKEDQRIIQIAYEGLTSERNKNYYKQLGIDTDEALKQAKEIIEIIFIIN